MTPALDLGPDGSTLTISPSQMDALKTCFTYYKYRYLFRRVAEEPAAALVAGSAFDAAINLRYSQCGSKPVTEEVSTAQHCLIDAEFGKTELPFDEYRNAALFKQALDRYNDTWQQEPWEVLAVQKPFDVELGTVEMSEWCTGDNGGREYCPRKVCVRLRGIIDLKLRTSDGHILIADTKTSNAYTDMTIVQHQNSAQAKAYCWAESQGAEQVHGFMLNAVVVRKPYNEGRKPKSTDLPRFEFHRPRCYFSKERLDEWRQNTLDWVSMMLNCVAEDRFPMNESRCANHFGKACPYLRVCESQPSQREDVLASDLYKDYVRTPIDQPATDELTPA